MVMSSHGGAAGGIHGLLLKLHETLSDEDSRAGAFRGHDLVGDLGQECMLSSTENDLGKTAMVSQIGPLKVRFIDSAPTSINNPVI